MSRRAFWCLPILALALPGGCPLQDNSGNTLTPVVAGDVASSDVTPAEPVADGDPVVLAGRVTDGEDYELYELGSAQSGQRWRVADGSGLFASRPALVVLLDENYDLLYRQIVTRSAPLEHILRSGTDRLYLGVASATGGSADYSLDVTAQRGFTAPAPRRQVVWLNFAGAQNANVHGRSLSFQPLDGRMFGDAYADSVDTIKQAITNVIRADYAAYEVIVYSSDDGPAPADTYATLHFGSEDSRLLGLADNVDQYNSDGAQAAVIYVESFADFWTMELTDEEMGQMVGNVASHEFGHLLGLYHTRVPQDLMDTTGSAWDLAADQEFLRAALEPSVFPFGYENSPARLEETVGLRPEPDGLAKPLVTQTIRGKSGLKALTRQVLRGRCGTCLELNE